MVNGSKPSMDTAAHEQLSSSAAAQMNKTPMFQAIHAQRYQRQALIKTISAKTGRPLICYVSGIATRIDRDDTVFLVDLLHNIQSGSDLDLMLHTPGGDIDAAEKLISIVRTRVGVGRLRVIVPDYAKSAGTLMALGADEILMSDTSELGPIDPQIDLNDGHGNLITHSVQSYLDAYQAHSAALQNDPNNITARVMLGKLDPAILKVFEAVRERARSFAENQLKRGMCKAAGNYTAVAKELIDTNRWLTHGQMIGWEDATGIGLCVKYVDPFDPQWQAYWQLYCHQRLAIKDSEKIFESEYASLVTSS
jgi:hypothetical protein